MIPKIIHYTWFSGEEMPQVVKDCIDSWKRFMPDYQYRLWDMDAIKDIDSVFLREALAARKWAFASDYVRLYALLHEGGIYLDTDVRVYQRFDQLLENDVFIGKEDAFHQVLIEWEWAQYLSSHCMGAIPQAAYIQDCIRYYDHVHFTLSANEQLPERLRYNYVLMPYVQAVIAREYGYDWTPKNQSIQHCKNHLTIYPSHYFCGTKNQKDTYCEHLTLGSWRNWDIKTADDLPMGQRIKRQIRRALNRALFTFSYVLVKIQ